ncbi:CHASE2 domain-containing protein [Sneathiella limimaris]|uniref:CHASE2 domain-containing protein n=1 Tax=Sneathiella limimaris TaxID=1964213 RepID=UPI00146F8972|nr:adenylate/guanylate cyclase domain-containing protein [Sneathiella limimaris]
MLKKLSQTILGKASQTLGTGRFMALCLLLPALYLQVLDPGFMQNFRNSIFDYYQQWQPREPIADQPVAVLDIDEKSLLQLGQWPWPRNYLAAMVQNVTRMGGIVIGFDMVFAEEDRLSPNKIAQNVGSLSPSTEQELNSLQSFDQVFANQLARSRAVLGIAVNPSRKDVNNLGVDRVATIANLGPNPVPYLRKFPGLIGNIEVLDKAASGRGMISLDQGFDGIVRRVPLANVVDGKVIPTLALDMLRVATGRNVISQVDDQGMVGFKVAGTLVPTDKFGRIWIKYSEFDPTRYISTVDVITGQIDPKKIAGKFLLVGTSATGLKDLRSSPLQSSLPGVEMHLQLLENILTQSYLFRLDYFAVLEWAGTAGTGLFLILLVPIVGARMTMFLLMFISSVAISSSLYLFSEFSLLIDVSYTLFISLLVYINLVYFNYLSTEKERTQIRTAFSHYLSPDLVSQLSESPDSLVLGGEEKEMTFLFSDIRDFTGISENYRDNPQGLTHLINRFLTPLTDEILSHKGTIDKYMGDAIMAFWNAPLDTPDHEILAARAALTMQKRLEALNHDLKEEAEQEKRPYRALRMGIGLNTGTCIVGNLGSAQRFDYSVLGDPVNLASRLEGQSKTYGLSIIVGEDTAKKLTNFALIELDLIAVKGRSGAVTVYGLLGDENHANNPEFLKCKETAHALLEAYRSQNWDVAREKAKELKIINPHLAILSDLYLDRLAAFELNQPPANWDGIYRATTK